MCVFNLPPLPRHALAQLAASDTLVLTVNNRLARQLLADLVSTLIPTRPVAELPHIVPLANWFGQAADSLAFVVDTVQPDTTQPDVALPSHRLDAFAAQQLWLDVIAACEAGRPLLDVSLAAHLASDADHQMDEWALSVPAQHATPEYQRFAVWRAAYRQRLRELDASDANVEIETVLAALAAGHIHTPQHVVLAGFGNVSPRLQRLVRGLQQHGAQCQVLAETEAEPAASTQILRWQAHDHDTEWQAAADWAMQQLHANPRGRYAIIAATLEHDAPLARRLLTHRLRDADNQPLPFNVAVGRPLADWPAVRAALAWLRVWAAFGSSAGDGANPASCPVALLGQALLAGHCAGEWHDAQTARAHAALDVQWRRRQLIALTHNAWCQALTACPRLAAAWTQARQVWPLSHTGNTLPHLSAERWASVFRAALAALGFPGERPLDSVAYQVCTAFDALLTRYAALHLVSGASEATAAVALLEKLAQHTPFQPSRDPAARLDVLGLLEAEGGRWDSVWVLGLSDEVLPASPKPNPLLPLAVLRAAGAPRATPERERQWADERYAALCACAPRVIVSHPAQAGERRLRPAPLIAALPLHALCPQAAATDEPETKARPQIELEAIDDAIGLPLSGHATSQGGLDVLETQARNPLWAYVRHRLGARALDDYAEAITTRARGHFLHAALETLAAMLPDQASLHASTADRRVALIAQATEHAATTTLTDWPAALRDLECARAQRILADWLAFEAQRAPYAIVAAEQSLTWQHGSLALTVRLDRIDRLADGRLVIIDYKTAARLPNPLADWTRERPVALQLPFYAAVLHAEKSDDADTSQDTRTVAALMLAQLHARSIAVAGIADGDVGVPDLSDAAQVFDGKLPDATWPAVLTRWQRAITQLADEYLTGVATNTALCRDDLQYCDALAFLRLVEDTSS